MHRPFPRHRKPTTKLALIAALTVGLLAVPVTSALAGPPYDDGNGNFVAAAKLNPLPELCATYSNYRAHLAFPDGTVARVSSRVNPLSKQYQWGEFFDGTYNPQTDATGNSPVPGFTSCTTGPGAQELGFKGTLTNGTTVNCNLGRGTYQRGALGDPVNSFPELNIEFVFNGPYSGTGCPTAPQTIKTTIVSTPDGMGGYVSACNAPIAPTSCVLGPAVHSGGW